MAIDWKTQIAIAWVVKEKMREADRRQIWEYRLPRVAADERSLHAVEATFQHDLDPHYRTFLTYADGWPDFWHSADLFGTEELKGARLMELANERLSIIGDLACDEEIVRPEDLLPIAVAKHDRNVFVLVKPAHRLHGQVIWLSGGVVDRFPNFDEFFLTMVDYNRGDLQWLQEGAGQNHDGGG
jgi:hypothetical protein